MAVRGRDEAEQEDPEEHQREFGVPQGSVLQLPNEEAVVWIQTMLKKSTAFQTLHKHFEGEGYTFYFGRAKVFVHSARDINNNIVPSVLGILPSFVPVTSSDPRHPAVGISVHHSGYAIATSVEVSHEPFGVTEFTLHKIDPVKKSILSSTLSAEDVAAKPVSELAKTLHAPGVSKRTAPKSFPTMPPGDQGLVIGTVVQQLLADNFSRALFPPEYARALSMQTPTFQKFAFAAGERFVGTQLDITLSTSSSTSSNICTSTSTSTIEI